jgi:hypothetical protein
MPRTQFFSVPLAVAVRREGQKTAALAAVHAAAAVVLKLPGAAVKGGPAPARERVINGLFPFWLRSPGIHFCMPGLRCFHAFSSGSLRGAAPQWLSADRRSLFAREGCREHKVLPQPYPSPPAKRGCKGIMPLPGIQRGSAPLLFALPGIQRSSAPLLFNNPSSSPPPPDSNWSLSGPAL